MITAENLSQEIDKLVATANQVKRIAARTHNELLELEDTVPNPGLEVETWVEQITTKTAKLEVSRNLLQQMDQRLELLRKKRQSYYAALADQELSTLFAERNRLSDEVQNGNWTIDRSKHNARIAEINRIFEARKYGF